MGVIADKNFITWLASNVHFRLLVDEAMRKNFTRREDKWNALEKIGEEIAMAIDGKSEDEIPSSIKALFPKTLDLLNSLSPEYLWEIGDYLLAFNLPRPPFSQEIGVVNSAEQLLEIFEKRKTRYPGIVDMQVFEMHDYYEDGRIKTGKWVYVIK